MAEIIRKNVYQIVGNGICVEADDGKKKKRKKKVSQA